ncbi:MAG: hypothetical protein B7X04_01380 [Parcubacteria group bacterium 21-54-25]|nr:MAG: hypothetical protein B7X04_01380 [Parcubacteria group bacterium 21-54-25]HQU07581.1 hypothetical protein [Candidatus Paceibacterota bacterium]
MSEGQQPANHINPPSDNKERVGSARPRATAAAIADGKVLVELVYDAERERTGFARFEEGHWRLVSEYTSSKGRRLVPYAAQNNLISNRVVLLPSAPEEYGTHGQLLGEIEAFIHRYVDVSPTFEKIASHYVLLSWLYDGFNELPYLRLRGDYGSGKTRFLLTVGALCYKPIFASGASTISPIFHILDAFQGTLVIDEADFRFSDEKADMVKILNNGNVRGIPILRNELSPTKEYNPRAFQVFGPKIVATRGYYQDRALESRFITEEMGTTALRDEIPINLPTAYQTEALALRNKLLLYRFHRYGRAYAAQPDLDRTIEPRLRQILAPLMSVGDESLKEDLRLLARQYHRDMLAERGMDTEARVLEAIRELATESSAEPLTVKAVTERFTARFGGEADRPPTNKWIGGVIRRRLNLHTQKSHGNFIIPRHEQEKLARLYERYGL